MFSDFNVPMNHNEDSDTASLGWNLGVCISNKLRGEARASGPLTLGVTQTWSYTIYSMKH